MGNKKNEIIEGKMLPNNYEAEQAVLSCTLIDGESALMVVSKLEEIDFYNEIHRYIFRAIKGLFKDTIPIDFVSVNDRLEQLGLSNAVGGISYISSLSTLVPSSAGCSHYIEIVKRDSILRQLIQASNEIAKKAYESSADINLISTAEKMIYDIAEKGQNGTLEKIDKSAQRVIEEFELIHKQGGGATGVKTGLYQLDRATNGLQKSDLIVLAARPGIGKTSLALNIVTNAAINNGSKCAIFSLEMKTDQLTKRMLCSVANVSEEKCARGELDANDWAKIWNAKDKITKADIYINDHCEITPSQILSECRKLKRENGLDLIVVDYIGLIQLHEKTDNRQNEVANISRQLKILAKDINVPVITLCQLNRAIETADTKDGKPRKPVLSDLRESGSIEQDADMVWFIHRERVIGELDAEKSKNYTAELIIAKFRNGQPGSVFLGWDGSRTTFYNLEKDANEQSLVEQYEKNHTIQKNNKQTIEEIKNRLSDIVKETEQNEMEENSNNGNIKQTTMKAEDFTNIDFEDDLY